MNIVRYGVHLLLGLLCIVVSTLCGMQQQPSEQSISPTTNILKEFKYWKQLPEGTHDEGLNRLIESRVVAGEFVQLREDIKQLRASFKSMHEVVCRLAEPGRTQLLVAKLREKHPELLVTARALDYWILPRKIRKDKWKKEEQQKLTSQQRESIKEYMEHCYQDLRIPEQAIQYWEDKLSGISIRSGY